MRRVIILTLAAGLLSVGTPALLAQVSTNAPVQNETQKPSPQQRQMARRRLMKLLGLDSKDLKSLTPQERRAKIKDATDQKISQLEQKKTDGSITAEEASDLAFLQQSLHHRKSKATSAN